jgi:hypothetical protein
LSNYTKFLIHEFVENGSGANGIIQYWNSANGYIAINTIQGTFAAGDTVVGQQSGFTLTLTDFQLLDELPSIDWDQTYMVIADNGILAVDDHFTGVTWTQDYQRDHIIVESKLDTDDPNDR